MPTIIIPTVVKFALGALGAGAAIAWAVKEVRRINAELDRVKAAQIYALMALDICNRERS